MFEELGFKYFGPIDGHSVEDLIRTLELVKEVDEPVFLHVITQKGKGYRSAEETPSKYHGTGPFDPTTGKQHSSGTELSYSKVFGRKLSQLARTNSEIVAVGAAMLEGTGPVSYTHLGDDSVASADFAGIRAAQEKYI